MNVPTRLRSADRPVFRLFDPSHVRGALTYPTPIVDHKVESFQPETPSLCARPPFSWFRDAVFTRLLIGSSLSRSSLASPVDIGRIFYIYMLFYIFTFRSRYGILGGLWRPWRPSYFPTTCTGIPSIAFALGFTALSLARIAAGLKNTDGHPGWVKRGGRGRSRIITGWMLLLTGLCLDLKPRLQQLLRSTRATPTFVTEIPIFT